jgi:hypothetical protein
MKIRCGVPAYANGAPVGTVVGFRVDAVEDKLTAVLVRPHEPSANCHELDFRRVVSADNSGVRADVCTDDILTAAGHHCEEEGKRMEHWLRSLVPDVDDAEEIGYRYVVYSAADRGTFALSGSEDVALGQCGCGMFESVVVDSQGYITQLRLVLDDRTGATVYMRPLAKRSREELRGQGMALALQA